MKKPLMVAMVLMAGSSALSIPVTRPPTVKTARVAHVIDVNFPLAAGATAVTVHVGDTLRVHMQQSLVEDPRSWYAMNENSDGLRLVKREEAAEGDHGYASTIIDITYTYKVVTTDSGTVWLLFAYANPGNYVEAPSSLMWLSVKIAK